MAERETIRRQKLVEYFRKNLQKGYDLETLKWALIKQGHTRIDVSYAVEQVKDEFTKRNLVKEEVKPVLEENYGEEQSYFIPEKKPWWKFW